MAKASGSSGTSGETTEPSPRVSRRQRHSLVLTVVTVPERERSMTRARMGLAVVALAAGIADEEDMKIVLGDIDTLPLL